MEPISYWPVELVLDSSILYMLSNSKNVYEISALIIALFIHVKRQYENYTHIYDVSSTKSSVFKISILVAGFSIVWLSRVLPWPLPILVAICAGFLYHESVLMFIEDSGKQFNLFDPRIDVPQLFVSFIFSILAINNRNPVSILWVSDLVYHILELKTDQKVVPRIFNHVD